MVIKIPQNRSEGTEPVDTKDKVEAAKWKREAVNPEVAAVDVDGDAAT